MKNEEEEEGEEDVEEKKEKGEKIRRMKKGLVKNPAFPWWLKCMVIIHPLFQRHFYCGFHFPFLFLYASIRVPY